MDSFRHYERHRVRVELVDSAPGEPRGRQVYVLPWDAAADGQLSGWSCVVPEEHESDPWPWIEDHYMPGVGLPVR